MKVRKGNTLFVSQGEFQELCGGGPKRLEDLMGCPSRPISDAVASTLDGIMCLEALRDAGVTKIVDP